MAQFEPGQSGNPAGKKKGTLNKVTHIRKENLQKLIESIERDHLEADIQNLSARDRVKIYLAAHEYLVPKLGRVEVQEVTEIQELLLMSPEERVAEIQRIKEQLAKKK